MHTFLLSFLTVASLQFLAMISPGPDFALVTRNALLYPRHEAIYTGLGIALGALVHMSYCVFGLAFVISHSLFIFDILKYLGATYLIYIGLKSWFAKTLLAKNGEDISNQASTLSILNIVRQGFLCNLLNPKACLFFIGLFTLVIKPNTPLWQQSIYVLWMTLATLAWFSFVTCFITRPTTRYALQKIQPMVVKILGVLLIFMGVGLLFVSIKY
jgi:RhtB (resistance to homoserine/threonine) family protein